jgi:hypothetical protein
MIDPKAIGVQKGSTERRGEKGVTVLPDAFRMERSETPVLTKGKKAIRRGTAMEGGNERVRIIGGVEARRM